MPAVQRRYTKLAGRAMTRKTAVRRSGKKLLIDFEQSHRSDPAIAKTPPARHDDQSIESAWIPDSSQDHGGGTTHLPVTVPQRQDQGIEAARILSPSEFVPCFSRTRQRALK